MPIREVGARLGLDNEKPLCPNCGSGGGSDVAYLDDRNLLNCKHGRCAGRPNRTPVDLVAKVVFGCDNIAGTKGVVTQVLQWFTSNFGVKLPTNRTGMLDAILASDEEEVSMGNDRAETKPKPGAEPPSTDEGTDDDGFSYTEDGNALRFVKAHRSTVMYVEQHESFYVWQGSHWQQDPNRDRVVSLMRVLGRRMFDAAITIADEKARGAAVSWALKSQSDRSIRAAVSLARTDDRIRVDAGKLDADPDLLAVQNGTLDLSSKPPKHRAHAPEDYITKLVPIDYDGDATCPEFEKAVAATSTDPEVVKFRWRRFSSYLDGHPDQFIVIAWGLPGTGKSTIHEEIASVLGPHARKVPKSIFETTHHEGHPTDLTTLEGKRMAYGAEIKPQLNVDRINELTGDEVVSARGMRENFREIRHTWKMTFYTNKKPIIRADAQNGIWRRTIFDPWTNKVQSPKAPDEVKAAFRKERQGILARLVEAYADYQQNGLSPPASIMAATTQFKSDQDRLKPFLEKHCDLTDKTAQTPFRDVWARFSGWMHDLDPAAKISKKRLAVDLDAHGLVGDTSKDKAKTDVRLGIKLVDIPAVDEKPDTPGMSVDDLSAEELDGMMTQVTVTGPATDVDPRREELLEAV